MLVAPIDLRRTGSPMQARIAFLLSPIIFVGRSDRIGLPCAAATADKASTAAIVKRVSSAAPSTRKNVTRDHRFVLQAHQIGPFGGTSPVAPCTALSSGRCLAHGDIQPDESADADRFRSARWRARRLAAVERRQGRLRERMKMQVEADHRRRRVLVGVELVDVDRIDREDVVVGLVALGRTRAAVAGNSGIRPALDRALRRGVALRIAGALGERSRIGGDVEDDPVPESAAGRRIGIVDIQGEALRVLRSARPSQGG